jgi:protease YdgD
MSLLEIRYHTAPVIATAAVLALAPVLGSGAATHDSGTVDVNDFPWSSVSKIYNSARSSCTGSVVAPDKALTAAHCVFNPATHRFLPASSLHLLFGYDKGEYRVHARLASYVISPDYNPENGKASLLQDWALLTLTETLPSDTAPIPLATRSAVAGDPIMIAGFSQRHPFKMTADTNCQMHGVMHNGMLVHNCSVLPGDSGAPVLARAGKNVEIIGIQVASAEWNGSKVGLAVPVTRIAAMLNVPETELPRPQSE